MRSCRIKIHNRPRIRKSARGLQRNFRHVSTCVFTEALIIVTVYLMQQRQEENGENKEDS